jgi:hypothetical protein
MLTEAKRIGKHYEQNKCYLFFVLTPCVLGSEDGGSMFFRNVGSYLQVHTALQPIRPNIDFFTVVRTSDFNIMFHLCCLISIYLLPLNISCGQQTSRG